MCTSGIMELRLLYKTRIAEFILYEHNTTKMRLAGIRENRKISHYLLKEPVNLLHAYVHTSLLQCSAEILTS